MIHLSLPFLSLSKYLSHRKGAWFDKLTMIGETPFALSLWLDKLTTFVRSS